MFGQAKKDDEERLKQARLIAAYKGVFTGTGGRAVLDDLAAFGFLDKSTAASDSHISARYDGRREMILHILEQLNINITDYLTEHVVQEEFDYD